jgi:hypothetical protein
MDEWDRQLREVHAGQREHLKTWNQLTYDLGAMTRDEHGRPAGLQARDPLPLTPGE